MHLLHLFIAFNWSCLLPDISSFNVMFSTGFKNVLCPFCILSPMPDTVTDTLVWIWTVCMAPWGQKRPTVAPSSLAISIMTLSLHGCPGRDCLRSPMGEVSSTVPCLGGRMVQVTLLRGAGRQVGSCRGTDRRAGVFGQSLNWLHSDVKAQVI